MKRFINILFDKLGIDPLKFLNGMFIYFLFFSAIAIGMLLSGIWDFGKELFYFYCMGFILSIFFNLISSDNMKKNDD